MWEESGWHPRFQFGGLNNSMVMSLLATNEVGLGLFTLPCLWYTQGGDSQLATGSTGQSACAKDCTTWSHRQGEDSWVHGNGCLSLFREESAEWDENKPSNRTFSEHGDVKDTVPLSFGGSNSQRSEKYQDLRIAFPPYPGRNKLRAWAQARLPGTEFNSSKQWLCILEQVS